MGVIFTLNKIVCYNCPVISNIGQSMETTKTTIVLAEDHALVRAGTRRILEQVPEFQVIGEADDGQQALELIQKLHPDVAILDIRMPKLNGIEVVRQMKILSPNTKSLMLTAYDDDEYVLALMEAGATGYLLKTAREKELIDSVREVCSGEPVLDPAIAVKIARLWAHRGTPGQKTSEQLSPRELEVLELAAKGLRNKAIADKMGISNRTVEGHFNGIFSKLNVASRMEAVLEGLSRHLISISNNSKNS
jgi:DNA-binding NarL/FixJ family response regulator